MVLPPKGYGLLAVSFYVSRAFPCAGVSSCPCGRTEDCVIKVVSILQKPLEANWVALFALNSPLIYRQFFLLLIHDNHRLHKPFLSEY